MGYIIDMRGKVCGRLTVVKLHEKHPTASEYLWECSCKCGNSAIVRGSLLRSGTTKSCGCLRRELAKVSKHGMSQSSEYRIWRGMINRCYNSNTTGYRYYGGRGVQVCSRWKASFIHFFEDMGYRPTKKHSIERIDTNGDYNTDNCVWAVMKRQSRNRRNNRLLTFNGKTQCVASWAEELSIDASALYSRLERGWSTEKTLSTPGGLSIEELSRPIDPARSQ